MLGPSPTAFSSDPPCVVIDNGSGRIKVGFSGAELPKAVLPTSGLEGVSDDRRPLAHGIIADWDAMESYWDHAFSLWVLAVFLEETHQMCTDFHLYKQVAPPHRTPHRPIAARAIAPCSTPQRRPPAYSCAPVACSRSRYGP